MCVIKIAATIATTILLKLQMTRRFSPLAALIDSSENSEITVIKINSSNISEVGNPDKSLTSTPSKPREHFSHIHNNTITFGSPIPITITTKKAHSANLNEDSNSQHSFDRSFQLNSRVNLSQSNNRVSNSASFTSSSPKKMTDIDAKLDILCKKQKAKLN